MRAGLLALMFVALGPLPAFGAPQDVANEISGEVMSPFCDGVTLHDCPSQTAADLRAQIEQWASQGWTKAEIIDELENRYGERIYATPRNSEGLGAWILPGLALIAGLAGAGLLARRWARRTPTETPPVAAADHARVERELAALREEPS